MSGGVSFGGVCMYESAKDKSRWLQRMSELETKEMDPRTLQDKILSLRKKLATVINQSKARADIKYCALIKLVEELEHKFPDDVHFEAVRSAFNRSKVTESGDK
jgi:hypothetical protein